MKLDEGVTRKPSAQTPDNGFECIFDETGEKFFEFKINSELLAIMGVEKGKPILLIASDMQPNDIALKPAHKYDDSQNTAAAKLIRTALLYTVGDQLAEFKINPGRNQSLANFFRKSFDDAIILQKTIREQMKPKIGAWN